MLWLSEIRGSSPLLFLIVRTLFIVALGTASPHSPGHIHVPHELATFATTSSYVYTKYNFGGLNFRFARPRIDNGINLVPEHTANDFASSVTKQPLNKIELPLKDTSSIYTLKTNPVDIQSPSSFETILPREVNEDSVPATVSNVADVPSSHRPIHTIHRISYTAPVVASVVDPSVNKPINTDDTKVELSPVTPPASQSHENSKAFVEPTDIPNDVPNINLGVQNRQDSTIEQPLPFLPSVTTSIQNGSNHLPIPEGNNRFSILNGNIQLQQQRTPTTSPQNLESSSHQFTPNSFMNPQSNAQLALQQGGIQQFQPVKSSIQQNANQAPLLTLPPQFQYFPNRFVLPNSNNNAQQAQFSQNAQSTPINSVQGNNGAPPLLSSQYFNGQNNQFLSQINLSNLPQLPTNPGTAPGNQFTQTLDNIFQNPQPPFLQPQGNHFLLNNSQFSTSNLPFSQTGLGHSDSGTVGFPSFLGNNQAQSLPSVDINHKDQRRPVALNSGPELPSFPPPTPPPPQFPTNHFLPNQPPPPYTTQHNAALNQPAGGPNFPSSHLLPRFPGGGPDSSGLQEPENGYNPFHQYENFPEPPFESEFSTFPAENFRLDDEILPLNGNPPAPLDNTQNLLRGVKTEELIEIADKKEVPRECVYNTISYGPNGEDCVQKKK